MIGGIPNRPQPIFTKKTQFCRYGFGISFSVVDASHGAVEHHGTRMSAHDPSIFLAILKLTSYIYIYKYIVEYIQ